MRHTEGFLTVHGYRTWYRILGERDSPNLPLLVLHGGPGTPWPDRFEFAESVAASGRTVVVYDQLGCGRSDRPADRSLWSIEAFLDELAIVRRELHLDRVHLLGYSWGGTLALAHVLDHPDGVAGLVLSSTPFNMPLWLAEAKRLRATLPRHVRRTMRRYERTYRPAPPEHTWPATVRTGVSPAQARRRGRALRLTYRLVATAATQRLASWASAVPPLRRLAYDVAALEYLRRYVCRRAPMPPAVFESMAGANLRLYETMWGPGEYFATGELKDWDVTDRLGEVEVPTLITSGRYDEATPTQMRLLTDRVADSRWVMFDDSAHLAIFEEPERYLAVVSGFLAEVEARALA